MDPIITDVSNWPVLVAMIGLIALAVLLVACCNRIFNNERPPNQFYRVTPYREIPRHAVVPNSGGHQRPLHRRREVRGYQDPELLQFHSFIQRRVIPGFKGQRQQEYQFAVLLLIPKSELNNINRVSFQPQDSNQDPLVNNANYYSPNRSRYRNYVAARPDRFHSEITLLKELPYLWDAFRNSYHCVPSYIILYSWMMPCPDCTRQICQTLRGTKFKNTPVIVTYTIDWIENSDVINQKSRSELEAARIQVEQVRYLDHLPPAQER